MKRKYKRLSHVEWAEIRALWELGNTSLSELAERFGVTIRTVQTHLSRHAVQKGCKAVLFAAGIQEELVRKGLPDRDITVERAKDVKEAAYANACWIEAQMMTQLKAAQDDPANAHRTVAAIKALASAAAALERIHAVKLKALGLDNGAVLADELPTLTIRELTLEEVEQIRAGQASPQAIEQDDCLVLTQPEELFEISVSHEDNDIVVEDGHANLDHDGCRILS